MGHSLPAFWHGRRVFVTGCTGFLGGYVVRELLDHGADVVGLVRDRVRDSAFVHDRLFERISVVRGRVEDRGRIETALAIHDIQTVFHLARPDPQLAVVSARWITTLIAAAVRANPTGELVIPVRPGEPAVFARQTAYRVIPVRLPPLTDNPAVRDAVRVCLRAAEPAPQVADRIAA